MQIISGLKWLYKVLYLTCISTSHLPYFGMISTLCCFFLPYSHLISTLCCLDLPYLGSTSTSYRVISPYLGWLSTFWMNKCLISQGFPLCNFIMVPYLMVVSTFLVQHFALFTLDFAFCALYICLILLKFPLYVVYTCLIWDGFSLYFG